MLLIKDILISDRIFEVNFLCDLKKCKGACCWEGDYGAPLSEKEIKSIKSILPQVKEMLPEENQKVLDSKGPSEYYKEPEVTGTALMPDASCVYLIKDENGIGQCSFEILFNKNESSFKKPISCELYPIRLIENEEIGFVAMNYDEWDICNPGCKLGKKVKMPLFRFLKNPIIRRFDENFYEELESYYKHLNSK